MLLACADTNLGFGDGGGTDVGGVPLSGLKEIRIAPADAVLEITSDKPAQQTYQAFGRFADGTEREITAQTAFNAENASIGVFNGNIFSSGIRGGKTVVVAEAGGVRGMTHVTVLFKRRFFSVGVAETVAKGFDSAKPATARAPTLVYPLDRVMIPPNLVEMDFQWLPGQNNDLFEIALSNEHTDVRIYTTCDSVGEGCGHRPDEATWKAIVAALSGTDPAKVTVRGTDGATMQEVGASESRELSVSEEEIKGGLYYWDATSGNIVRYDFGKPGQQATTFYTKKDAEARDCVGCHAMSRDGKRIAVGLDDPGPSPLKILDVASRKLISSGKGNFYAFSPDASKIITSNGKSMELHEVATLATLEPKPLVANGTMPDWSGDGSRVVFADNGWYPPFDDVNPGRVRIWKGSLKLLPFDGATGTWGTVSTLVPSNNDNNYYPAFSPDGDWIVFNRCTSCDPSTEWGTPGSSYDAKDARLWLLRADGKSKPTELKLANGEGDQATSWPKFSPFVHQVGGSKLLWLTFSSRRDYGLRLLGKYQAQIWMVAIYPSKAEFGDPSAAPFWLPFQDIKTGNHIAQWAETVVRQPCQIDPDCPGSEFCDKGFCEGKGPD
jgi:hypothetical protein